MRGYVISYIIARMRSRWATVLLVGIVVTSFVTIVIKAYGMDIMFAANGWLHRFLMAIGLIDQPYSILGNQTGVVIGLMYCSLGFAILLLYGVIQTIPRSLEEAAQIHGASRLGGGRDVQHK